MINPATGTTVGSVPKGEEAEAILAVDAAQQAFDEWSGKAAEYRSMILRNWFQLIRDHTDEIARILTEEQGKPIAEAVGEVTYANSFIEWFSEEGKRIYGDTIPASSEDKRIFVIKQPVGVVAAITPYNFPAAMITRKVASALAAGCTVVVKPASQMPFMALKLAELAEEAGFPPGVLNIVTGQSEKKGKSE